MFESFTFNIWAVLVSVVINMLIGALWYSPVLFGNIWLKLIEKKAEDIGRDEGNKAMALAIVPAIVSAAGLSVLIGISDASGIVDAIIIGSLASIAFSGMSLLNLVFFEDRKFSLVLLNAGYAFVSFNIISIILTLWK
ncbi:MAG: DUF1761 domain-containing protein [Spirochaetales bacterium]|uniref:DUF1761 domain-containing protein n=1 Tax=Candidatus Thalassospirochaeta sargassi TaxID=3119039 RepID=A0AAJ1IDV6_9SPIO|nr:DUF1761 domain-containing protein [Spirochaetales bacterium]